MTQYDAIVVGGGFYGCFLALHLRKHFKRVLIIERENALLKRASYRNQARLHNGHHYPRSFRTAASSQSNLKVFMQAFPDSVVSSFNAIYCIAKSKSMVSSHHFEKFCNTIGATVQPASEEIRSLFSPRLIKSVYAVEEYAFDCNTLRETLETMLEQNGVEVRTHTSVLDILPEGEERIRVGIKDGSELSSQWVLNCTYAGLHHIKGLKSRQLPPLKQQIAELALVEPPPALKGLGITVMDGPFFSFMPFPSHGLHSLSHVRYTHHFSWTDRGDPESDPEKIIAEYGKESNYRYMLDDAARYVPELRHGRYVESLFEVKTLLPKSDIDDSRPIYVEEDERSSKLLSILGGKLDNIFDVVEHLDQRLGVTTC